MRYRILIVVCLVFIISAKLLQAQLPQNYQWQITLRDYIASFQESDFALPIDNNGRLPLVTAETSLLLNNDDEWMYFWNSVRNRARDVPDPLLIRVAPEHFLLSSIEAGNDVRAWRPANIYNAAWWLDWKYPGNPYYTDPDIRNKLKNRLLVQAAVSIIMKRHHGSSGMDERMSGYIGPAYAYSLSKDVVPANVQEAFEEGLSYRFNEHLPHDQASRSHAPRGVHADMDFFSVVAMWYIAKGIGTQEAKEQAYDYAKTRVFRRHFWPTGYVDHGDGFDVSYQGMTNSMLIHLGLATNWDFMSDVMDRVYKLRAHISFPEPDSETSFAGPTHFSTSTPGDTWDEQQPYRAKWVLAAMQSDWAKYIPGRVGYSWFEDDWPEDGERSSDFIADRINKINFDDGHQQEAVAIPRNDSPPVWRDTRYQNVNQLASAYRGPDGFYSQFEAERNAGAEITKSPFERSENFIRSFPEVDLNYYEALDVTYEGTSDEWRKFVDWDWFKKNFLVAKFDTYATVIHTGRLSWWDYYISGLGGGALSAFWTPDTGPVLLGRGHGGQSPSGTEYHWNHPDGRTWRIWASHAISGQNSAGAFSTATRRYVNREYKLFDSNNQETTDETEAVWARVIVNDIIGDNATWIYRHGNTASTRTVENPGVLEEAQYRRIFDVREQGITIYSELTSDGSAGCDELWEMIPVYLGKKSSQQSAANTRIFFEVNDNWIEAGTSLQENVTRVKVERFNGEVFIVFTEPRSVKLSPVQSVHNRNIMVDLLGDNTHLPTETSVEYTISPVDLPVQESPGDVGLSSPDNNVEATSTTLTFQWKETAGEDSYHLQIATVPDFSSVSYENQNSNGTSQTVSGFAFDTEYFWRVRGRNGQADGNWSEVRSFITMSEITTFKTPLDSGWNTISSPLQPVNPAMEEVFDGINENIVIVKNHNGSVYLPTQGINDIGEWNYQHGYQLYVDGDHILTLTGRSSCSESNPVQLSQGWNILSYLNTTPMNVSQALSPISDKIKIVVNNAAHVYWPEYDINTVGDMIPGQGYKIKIKEDIQFSYPSCDVSAPNKIISGDTQSTKISEQAEIRPERYTIDFPNTGDHAIFLVQSSDFDDGDEVGVWSNNDELVGSGVAQNGKALVSVWGKNPVLSNDGNSPGAISGETLRLTLWSTGQQGEFPLSTTQVDRMSGSQQSEPVLRYRSNAVQVIDAERLHNTPEQFALEQNYPNPFNPTTVIRYGIPDPSQVRLEIYNALGQRIKVLVDDEQQAGHHQVVFNAGNIASGVYFYRLQAGRHTEMKRMVLVR